MVIPRRRLTLLAGLITFVLLYLYNAQPRAGSRVETIGDAKDDTKSADEPLWDAIDKDGKVFEDMKWPFQDDLKFKNPRFDVKKLKAYAPHNHKGPGQKTFATYFATRNASLQDPYFLAAQQLTYRVLWDPKSKSKYQMTVFVPPFIPDEQRDFFSAAGADVRELALIPWKPKALKVPERWQDQFSKLNLWNQTEFSRIAYLDTDAFPIKNPDALLDRLSPKGTCRPDLASPEDKNDLQELCDYTFAAVKISDEKDDINGGVFVINPNKVMHARLLRESKHTERFGEDMVEQSFLTYAFGPGGPFPVHYIEGGKEWNGFFPAEEDEGRFNIVHEKLWAGWFAPGHWLEHLFEDNWAEMLKFYESNDFVKLRAADGKSS